MLFKPMPKMFYKVNEKSIAVKDIFRRVALDKKINSKLALTAYYVPDGHTPDMVAHNVYGSSNYHWVVLSVNEIINVKQEWPKASSIMVEYTESKYGTGNATKDHHYRLTSDITITVDYDAAKILDGTIQSVSNLDHELELNEEKRQIYLLDPRYLAGYVTQYNKLMAK